MKRVREILRDVLLYVLIRTLEQVTGERVLLASEPPEEFYTEEPEPVAGGEGCPDCDGSGQKRLSIEWGDVDAPCATCRGTGRGEEIPF